MKNYLFLTILLSSVIVFGHGEAELGPHKGHVRMPGAFHTEVVLEGPNKLRVFLLDINFKNPSVHDSSLEVSFDQGKVTAAKCKKLKLEYLCEFDRSIDLNKPGKLLVKASREKQIGAVAEYPTPLQ